jgi:peptide/nickel transport system substrate-binding protein
MDTKYLALGVLVIVAVAAVGAYYLMTPPAPEPECVSDADCPEGYVCVNGECVEEEPEEPTELVAILGRYPKWDPQYGGLIQESTLYNDLYDSLTWPDRFTGKAVPWVAKNWTVSPDGKTWTFEIRQGIKFHDGSELTGEDVKFTMDRMLTMKRGWAYLYLPYVNSTDLIDDYTVQFNMKKPVGIFHELAVRLYIINKDLVMANIKTPGDYGEFGDYAAEWFGTGQEVGSGPYVLDAVAKNEFILLKKFDDYWDPLNPQAPDIKRYLEIQEVSTIRAMMLTGELHISSFTHPPEVLAELDEDPNIDIGIWPVGGVNYVMMHTQQAPTDDIHFRKALSWAFPYEQVNTEVYGGYEQPIGPLNPWMREANLDLLQYKLNLTAAKEELEQSQYYDAETDSATMPVAFHVCLEDVRQEPMGLLFKESAAQIGIDIEVVNTPWLLMADEMKSIDSATNMYFVWVGGISCSGAEWLQTRYHSAAVGTFSQNEYLLDPELDAAIEDAIATVDDDERLAKVHAIQRDIVDRTCTIFANVIMDNRAYRTDVFEWPIGDGSEPGYVIHGYMTDSRANLKMLK